MKECPKCRRQMDDEVQICPRCGAKMPETGKSGLTGWIAFVILIAYLIKESMN